MKIAIVSPGILPVLGKSRSSVEIAIDEVVRRLAVRHHIQVYGRARHAGTQPMPGGGVLHSYSGHGYSGWLAARLRASRPDIVQVENRPLLAVALRRGLPRSIPVVLSLHSLTYIRPSRYGRRRIRAALGAPNAVIVNSDGLARYVRRTYPRACRRLSRVHLGVNLGAFRPHNIAAGAAMRQAIRAKYEVPRDAKLILFVGRLIPQKGVHFLIAALPKVRRALGDVRLLVVGGARCGGWVRTGYVKQLLRRARVTPGAMLAGYVPHQTLPAYYSAADVVVTPSTGHEALCLVNLEAMASALPVVSTRIGGVPEVVINEQTGLLISPQHVKRQLAPAITNALTRAAEFGGNGRRRVEEHFTWERTAVQYEGIYTSLRAAQAGTPPDRHEAPDTAVPHQTATSEPGGADDSRGKGQGALRGDRSDGRGLLRQLSGLVRGRAKRVLPGA